MYANYKEAGSKGMQLFPSSAIVTSWATVSVANIELLPQFCLITNNKVECFFFFQLDASSSPNSSAVPIPSVHQVLADWAGSPGAD